MQTLELDAVTCSQQVNLCYTSPTEGMLSLGLQPEEQLSLDLLKKLVAGQDGAYTGAGARVAGASEALGSDVVLKVQPPSAEEVERLKEHARCAGRQLPHATDSSMRCCCLANKLNR